MLLVDKRHGALEAFPHNGAAVYISNDTRLHRH